jgi:hypothetical protein
VSALSPINPLWLVPSLLVLLWIAAFSVRKLAALDEQSLAGKFGAPLLFGIWVLVFWELIT